MVSALERGVELRCFALFEGDRATPVDVEAKIGRSRRRLVCPRELQCSNTRGQTTFFAEVDDFSNQRTEKVL